MESLRCRVVAAMGIFRDERVKQVIVAASILFGVLVLTIAIRLAGAAPGVLERSSRQIARSVRNALTEE